MSFFDKVMEAFNWLLIFISPFLISAIIAAVVYFSNPNNYGISLSILAGGFVSGVLFAERIRRRVGTTTFMGRLRGNSEYYKDDKKEE